MLAHIKPFRRTKTRHITLWKYLISPILLNINKTWWIINEQGSLETVVYTEVDPRWRTSKRTPKLRDLCRQVDFYAFGCFSIFSFIWVVVSNIEVIKIGTNVQLGQLKYACHGDILHIKRRQNVAVFNFKSYKVNYKTNVIVLRTIPVDQLNPWTTWPIFICDFPGELRPRDQDWKTLTFYFNSNPYYSKFFITLILSYMQYRWWGSWK